MVPPYDGRQEGDCQDGGNHGAIAEDGLAGTHGHHFRYNPHGGQDYDIYFRVAEEPEQVLIEYRGSSLVMQHLSLNENIGQEERGPEAPVRRADGVSWTSLWSAG